MKKIFHYIAGAIVALGFTACDSLDLEPESLITDANYWKTSDQFDAFNVGIHSYFRSLSGNFFLLGEARAYLYGDTPFGGEATQGMELLPYNTMSPVQPVIGNYAGMYGVINQCNLMISKLNDTGTLTEAQKNYYLGTAHGIRAYLYFQLLRSWGDAIIHLDYTSGTTIDLANINKKQSPAADVMKQIKLDIEASEKAFNNDYRFAKGKNYWSLGATQMLKGEVYLWSGKQMGGGAADYQTAKTALESVDKCPGIGLETDFAKVFSYDNKKNKEVIFSFVSAENEASLLNGSYRGNLLPQQNYLLNGSFYDEDGKLFKDTKDNQLNGLTRLALRKDIYFKLFRDGDSRLKKSLRAVYNKTKEGQLTYVAPFAYKFQGTMLSGTSERSMLDDFPVYRYADCLLLLAEAKALLGEDISTEINKIRKRAYGDNYSDEVAYPNDKGDFYNGNKFAGADSDPVEAVLKERFREFLFEGKRWYDIRLMGKTSEYSLAESGKLLWPIDKNTLTNNNALVQTKGY